MRQIAQIESFQAAVYHFETKYSALPGDISGRLATRYGFAHRGQYRGEGDGNGIIEGVEADAPGGSNGVVQLSGETAMFWSDLTYANGANLNLVEGSFNSASADSSTRCPTIQACLPAAKIGKGNYVSVFSGGGHCEYYTTCGDGKNYYSISVATGIMNRNNVSTTFNIPVIVAYDIDRKIDDGLPQSGSVTALFVKGRRALR